MLLFELVRIVLYTRLPALKCKGIFNILVNVNCTNSKQVLTHFKGKV